MNKFLVLWLWLLRIAAGEKEIQILPPMKAITGGRAGLRPHHQRTREVMAALESAPQVTYAQAINHVREVTGRGCSMRIVATWKKRQK